MSIPTERVLAVLSCFTARASVLSLSDVARKTQLPRATAHRLLDRLVSWGLLERSGDKQYVVGSRLWEIGVLAPSVYEQRTTILPFMEQLFLTTRMQCALSVLRPSGALVIDQLLGWRDTRQSAGLGEHLPLYATSPGIVTLAFGPPALLESVASHRRGRFTDTTIVDRDTLHRAVRQARHTSLAVSNGAFLEGTSSISAPIMGRSAKYYGALSVVWESGTAAADRLAPLVTTTAAKISAELQSHPDPASHPPIPIR